MWTRGKAYFLAFDVWDCSVEGSTFKSASAGESAACGEAGACWCALLALICVIGVVWAGSREDKIFYSFCVFGRFSAKVGPRNLPNGPGLRNAT